MRNIIFCTAFLLCSNIAATETDLLMDARILTTGKAPYMEEVEEITPLLRQLKKDLFEQNDHARLSVKRVLAALVFGGVNANILASKYCLDPHTIIFIFRVADGDLPHNAFYTAFIPFFLAETMHAKMNLRTLINWRAEEQGLQKKNKKKLRHLTKFIISGGAALQTLFFIRKFLTEFAPDTIATKIELGLCLPLFIPQMFTKKIRVLYQDANDYWNKHSTGKTPLIRQHRTTVLERLANTYRMTSAMSTEQLLDTAESITKLSSQLHRREQGHMMILALLHGLYHADAEERFHVTQFQHPRGYKTAKNCGMLLGLASGYGAFLTGKLAIAGMLGLVEDDYFTEEWTGAQNFSVYSGAAAMGAFSTYSACSALSKALGGMYCYFTGYDPNQREKVLLKHETTLSPLRGSVAILSLLTSSVLSFSEMWRPLDALGAAGHQIVFERNGQFHILGKYIPLLMFSALNYGADLNATYGLALQNLITSSIEFSRFRGKKRSSKFKDLEGQLRSSIQKMLVNTSQYVERLPDNKIEALWTFLQMSPSVLKNSIKRSLGMAYDQSVFQREDIVRLSPTAFAAEDAAYSSEEDNSETETSGLTNSSSENAEDHPATDTSDITSSSYSSTESTSIPYTSSLTSSSSDSSGSTSTTDTSAPTSSSYSGEEASRMRTTRTSPSLSLHSEEEEGMGTDLSAEDIDDIDRVLDETMEVLRPRYGFIPEVEHRPIPRQSRGVWATIRGIFSWNTNSDHESDDRAPLLAEHTHNDDESIADIHHARQPSLWQRATSWQPNWWGHSTDETTEQELNGMATDEEEFIDLEARPRQPTLSERLADWWYNRNYWYRKN